MFTKVPDTYPHLYNLAFGDKDPKTGDLDDRVITNNNDRDKVLATVANIIIEFCDHFDNPYIYAEGSTALRTRLYQMGIGGLWEEISVNFEVFGSKGNSWYKFEPSTINYEAFLFKRK